MCYEEVKEINDKIVYIISRSLYCVNIHMYWSFFQFCHHLVFHVFHKVSWCSGYHISLTPKRSRVRLNDKFSGSHPGSAKNIPLWDQRFSFLSLSLSLFLSICTVIAIIAVVVFHWYWYWYLSILFVNSTYRIFYSILFYSLLSSVTPFLSFFSFLSPHYLIISVPYSLSFSLEGQSTTHDAWSRISMLFCHVYLSSLGLY